MPAENTSNTSFSQFHATSSSRFCCSKTSCRLPIPKQGFHFLDPPGLPGSGRMVASTVVSSCVHCTWPICGARRHPEVQGFSTDFQGRMFCDDGVQGLGCDLSRDCRWCVSCAGFRAVLRRTMCSHVQHVGFRSGTSAILTKRHKQVLVREHTQSCVCFVPAFLFGIRCARVQQCMAI